MKIEEHKTEKSQKDLYIRVSLVDLKNETLTCSIIEANNIKRLSKINLRSLLDNLEISFATCLNEWLKNALPQTENAA